MIKVIVVDDHQLFIDGVKELLNAMDEIIVVGEALNGVDLIDTLDKQKADVLLLDMNMPKMDGLQVLQHLKAKKIDPKVIMLSMHDSPSQIEKCIKSGAHGYLLKNTDKEELEKAIQLVFKGENYYSAAVTQSIMQGMQQKAALENSYGHVELTDRELEVLKLIAEEETTNQIAEKLFISPHTVESHRKNLISKLGVKSLAGLVKYAVQIGIVD